jgi:uncharacterized protein (TIGR00730 family)
MSSVKSVLIFCGSRNGNDPAYSAMAEAIGTALAKAGIEIVFGAGSTGLMGVVGRAGLAAGGKVTGIIPGFLHDLEMAQSGLSKLITVETMHQRKALMWQRCDAVLALPGGIGTIDEVVETMTWNSLKLHHKAIYLMGSGHFWQPFLDLMVHMETCGFNHTPFSAQLTVVETVKELMQRLEALDPAGQPAIGQLTFVKN